MVADSWSLIRNFEVSVLEVCSRLRAVLVVGAKFILRGRRRGCGTFETRNPRFGWQVWEFVDIVKTMAGMGVRGRG